MIADQQPPIRPSGFLSRAIAFALDVLACSVIGGPSGVFLAGFLSLPTEQWHVYARPYAYIIYILYFSGEAIWGASLGKLALGLRVLNRSGVPASTRARSVRYIVKVSIFWCPLLAFLLGFTFLRWLSTGAPIFIVVLGAILLLSDKRTTVHDDIAGTMVAKTRR